jgi:hypothetical protein
MSDKWQGDERRYGTHPVRLTNEAGEVLVGVEYTTYPVDEPPLIEVPSIGQRLYASAWERDGWSIADDEAPR